MIPRELRVRAYQDNEGEVRIGFATPQPIVEAAIREFDQIGQDRALVERLIAMDALWEATPMEDAMGLADKRHGVPRDAEITIQRQRDRTSQMAICASIGWTVAVWVAIFWWLS